MGKKTRINLDEKLDSEIEYIKNQWINIGMRRVSKPDIIRMLIQKYKNDNELKPHREPKKSIWQL